MIFLFSIHVSVQNKEKHIQIQIAKQYLEVTLYLQQIPTSQSNQQTEGWRHQNMLRKKEKNVFEEVTNLSFMLWAESWTVKVRWQQKISKM